MEYGKELAAILEKVSVESDFFIEDSIKSRLDIILDNSERSKGVLCSIQIFSSFSGC
ncbi:hypothetical protein [Candidatus Tisiphia endosymbiont of Nedyus quadrimaculatus]|uniref:hypothetical protein n=1 Tax=Candidatus Tisiphia endosymbiont of Nedyus quadrimaculatus TaxID=3139332 RepID=UPI00345E180B